MTKHSTFDTVYDSEILLLLLYFKSDVQGKSELFISLDLWKVNIKKKQVMSLCP